MPASARAVLLADELEAVSRSAFLAHRMTAEDPGSDPGLPPELRAAVDQAGDDWPGGAEALVTAIANAAPDTFALLAGPLSQHPDPAVALAARRARPAGRAVATARHRKGKTRSRSARRRKGRRRALRGSVQHREGARAGQIRERRENGQADGQRILRGDDLVAHEVTQGVGCSTPRRPQPLQARFVTGRPALEVVGEGADQRVARSPAGQARRPAGRVEGGVQASAASAMPRVLKKRSLQGGRRWSDHGRGLRDEDEPVAAALVSSHGR